MLALVKFGKQVTVYGQERYSDEVGFMGKKNYYQTKGTSAHGNVTKSSSRESMSMSLNS